jgi:HD-like signal output (HDOD) protein
MLRGLLALLILAAVAAAAWSLIRRARSGPRGPTVRELLEAEPAESADVPAVTIEALPAPGAGALTSAEVYCRLHAVAFGIAPLDPPASAAHGEVAAATRAALVNAATEPRYAPRRPLLLPQLMRAVNEDDVSRRELAALIVRDPALTGNLLKLANSPFYRVSSQPVESIDRAIQLLGTEGIRSLIAAAVMQPVFRSAGGEFTRFPEVTWDHTFRSGTAAAAHSAMVEHGDPFAAQLLALVSGLASIIVFRVALDQYATRTALRPDVTVIAQLLDAYGATLARDVAASWELSDRMLDALADQVPGSSAEKRSPLGRSLHFGRLAGALAVLHANGDVDGEVAKATLHANEGASAQLDGIWTRLSTRLRT